MYLTKQEVAKLLSVSVRTITTYMQQGVIPNPKKIGGKLLWDEGQLHQRIEFSAPGADANCAKRGRPRKVKLA